MFVKRSWKIRVTFVKRYLKRKQNVSEMSMNSLQNIDIVVIYYVDSNSFSDLFTSSIFLIENISETFANSVEPTTKYWKNVTKTLEKYHRNDNENV